MTFHKAFSAVSFAPGSWNGLYKWTDISRVQREHNRTFSSFKQRHQAPGSSSSGTPQLGGCLKSLSNEAPNFLPHITATLASLRATKCSFFTLRWCSLTTELKYQHSATPTLASQHSSSTICDKCQALALYQLGQDRWSYWVVLQHTPTWDFSE